MSIDKREISNSESDEENKLINKTELFSYYTLQEMK